jgi:aspartyl-tRNA(Asn)/glutamyl-tRNA(Gln) amidotransferase subunit A
MKLHEYTAHQLTELLAAKEVSAVELTQDVLQKITQVEPQVQAYLCVDEAFALKQAADIDRRRAAGEQLGILAGIPYALKDNIATKEMKTTCASRMLENFQPPYNATVYQKLQNADGILLGKVNMDEFAMGSTTENSHFQVTRNPRNLDYVPGGSSGGSAAAVAADEAIFTLGSDTGGSIRQPASFCGVVGLKPTYGRVSRFGVVAFASSLDQVGPLAKDVTDCALVINLVSSNLRVKSFTRFCNVWIRSCMRHITSTVCNNIRLSAQ